MARTNNKKKKSGKGLRVRRRIALVCLALGAAICGLAYLLRERFILYPLACTGALLLIESLLLALRKKMTVAIIMVGVLCAAGIVLSPGMYHTVRFEGGTPDSITSYTFTAEPGPIVRLFRDLETADVSDPSVTDFSFLEKLPSLKKAVARGNMAFTDETYANLSAARPQTEFVYTRLIGGIPCDTDAEVIDLTSAAKGAEEIEEIIAAYPDKQVLYRLSLWGGEHSADETSLTLPDGSRFDRAETDAALRLLPSVTEVDLTATQLDADSIRQLREEYPGIAWKYTVILWGEGIAADETSLILPEGVTFHQEELDQALEILTEVKTVDLTAVKTDAVTADILTRAHPDIDFTFLFDADGVSIRSDAEKVTVTGELVSYSQYFRFMKDLKVADIEAVKVSSELLDGLMAENPGIEFYYSFDMFGVTVHSTDKKIVLDGHNVPSAERFEKFLPYLPDLTEADMCGCGLTNGDMAGLREKYPDIKFVWTLKFGSYTLRTDATMFSTGLRGDNHKNYDSNTFRCLRYCTDLEFLDLGHNHVIDISFLEGMTQMKVLILACNKIEDISVLADMNDLEYVELFSNHIKDFSPLANKTKLLDLNINRNKIRSIAPIKTCTSLERLWIGSCGLSNASVSELKQALPGAKVNTSAGEYPTTQGWREHERYAVIKKMYSEKKYIPFK